MCIRDRDRLEPKDIIKTAWPCYIPAAVVGSISVFCLIGASSVSYTHLALCTDGSGHDAAGYATPQGLRNVLLISATPYQWKHIISQRVCRGNTDETRIVLLKVWKELYELSPCLLYTSCCLTCGRRDRLLCKNRASETAGRGRCGI